MRRDYYAVLGIAATAPPREVRRAYQRLARQYSPDVNFWDERARELFEEIAEAFRVLGDPTARQMYDRFGHAGAVEEALPEGRRGDDVHAVVDLSFAELQANRAGQRIFGVWLEGVAAIANLDVFAAAGGRLTAYDQTVFVEVTDGVLDISFVAQRGDQPIVNAILVTEQPPGSPGF